MEWAAARGHPTCETCAEGVSRKMARSTSRWTRLVGLATMAVAAACSDEPAPRVSSAAPATCEIERRPLTFANGSEIYIEPSNLTAVGTEFLVTGAPTYRFGVGRGRNSNRLEAD